MAQQRQQQPLLGLQGLHPRDVLLPEPRPRNNSRPAGPPRQPKNHQRCQKLNERTGLQRDRSLANSTHSKGAGLLFATIKGICAGDEASWISHATRHGHIAIGTALAYPEPTFQGVESGTGSAVIFACWHLLAFVGIKRVSSWAKYFLKYCHADAVWTRNSGRAPHAIAC